MPDGAQSSRGQREDVVSPEGGKVHGQDFKESANLLAWPAMGGSWERMRKSREELRARYRTTQGEKEEEHGLRKRDTLTHRCP